MEEYVDTQRELLSELARETPDRSLRAGVNLKELIGQEELDALIEEHRLQWLNIYWDSPSGTHGALARSVGPQTLAEMGEGAAAYYLSAEPLPALELSQLAEEDVVYLVDVGRIDELDEAAADNSCVTFALPDPLWFEARRLNVSLH